MTQGSTIYSPEKAEAFLKRLRDTGSPILAGKSLGLSKELLRGWRKRYPEFKAQYEQAMVEVKAR